MVLEYLENGSLSTLIQKSAARQIPNPSRIAWYIFYCLIKGLIGMRYPPRGYHRQYNTWNRDNLWSENIPPLNQVLPEDGGMNNIHFDLDPYNVFLGPGFHSPRRGGDERQHEVFPIVKIADFGLMRTLTDQEANDATLQ
ncbi:hypothetical protein QBC38DRAFT_516765 [Podospora fimiseda]|uniref:Protein kinase domain-containing protein n=1 Tax=Podospora fimiseda TaxID=252190 RepID=A0AAN7BHP7_9PEZI|nr:hypothetical protein QBC38DRAFT_516765 [Podospora fimiseda]